MATYRIMVEQPWFQELLVDSHFMTLLEDISHKLSKRPVWTQVREGTCIDQYILDKYPHENPLFAEKHEREFFVGHPDKVVP